MDPQANVREIFKQCCEMYRHFVGIRHHTFSIGGALSAGLIALFVTDKIPINSPALENLLRSMIAACGALLSGIVIAVDWRLCNLVEFYYKCMEHYAKEMGDQGFFANEINPKYMARTRKIWLTQNFIYLLCAFGIIFWFVALVAAWK